MPRSMTGFARLEAKHPWATLIWELRSVNHRYLEPHFRLPDTLRALEQPLRDRVRKQLQRGKLEAYLHLQRDPGATGDLDINQELAHQISNAAHQINDLLADPAPVSALDILLWPGVIQEQGADTETIMEAALALFETALEQLVAHRLREGEELGQFIARRLDSISAEVAQVRGLLPGILQSQRQRLQARLEALKAEVDRDRLEQEMVYLAQKADVDEELDRIDTHVAEVKRALGQSGAIGRRLDFLMQELNREANTLSSKSVVSETTQVAVELKVFIEQMREQIQNIE
ncbi:YicC family protein [Exilibacterium tricleocarpae]|uniref:YicC family protein n=1 Tax=Exilibacterium tricleocarpae TaxID=2591008 RepID=A0A545TZC9_9GAMM|nr:YicC/YloC family endoribonuclease [Exilibacterium tricleocarpae]TQV82557.1 YicC family protein [Exilibacterium tricleocarpae]